MNERTANKPFAPSRAEKKKIPQIFLCFDLKTTEGGFLCARPLCEYQRHQERHGYQGWRGRTTDDSSARITDRVMETRHAQ